MGGECCYTKLYTLLNRSIGVENPYSPFAIYRFFGWLVELLFDELNPAPIGSVEQKYKNHYNQNNRGYANRNKY